MHSWGCDALLLKGQKQTFQRIDLSGLLDCSQQWMKQAMFPYFQRRFVQASAKLFMPKPKPVLKSLLYKLYSHEANVETD